MPIASESYKQPASPTSHTPTKTSPTKGKERLQTRAVQRLNLAIKSIFADAVVLNPSRPFAFVAAQLRELDQLQKLTKMTADRKSLHEDLPPLNQHTPARPDAEAPAHTRPSRYTQGRTASDTSFH